MLYSEKQTSLDTSSYGAKFYIRRPDIEHVIVDLLTTSRYLGVPLIMKLATCLVITRAGWIALFLQILVSTRDIIV